MVNKVLIFDLKGPVAHFRKFYTSSSSLSYSFPPRTALIGLLAGLMGKERDSYYEEFGADRCRIALSLRTPVRKIMQSVNYIRTKQEDGYAKAGKVIQRSIDGLAVKYPTALELVVPESQQQELVYRIYFWHASKDVFDDLHTRIQGNRFVYPPYLGLSELLGEIQFLDCSDRIQSIDEKGFVTVCTVINESNIKERDFGLPEGVQILQYVDERMPFEFGPGREIKRKENFVHEKNQMIIRAKLKSSCLEVVYGNGQETRERIVFMEEPTK